MKQYIDKSAVIAEIEKLQDSTMDEDGNFYSVEAQAEYDILCVLEEYLDTLEVKEEPASKDLGEYINELSKQFPEVSFAKLSRIAVRVAKWQKEQIMKDAIEREVKEDAGGYPYIDATELYDYDNDNPLAKAGDKVKVVVVKDE